MELTGFCYTRSMITYTGAQAQLISDALYALDGIGEQDQMFLSVQLVDQDLGVVGYFTEEEGCWLFSPMGA